MQNQQNKEILLRMTKQFNFGLAILLIFLFFCLWKSWDHSLHDFSNYYYGGQLLLDNQFDESIYNADNCNTIIKERYDPLYFGAYYPNPPSLAVLYSPCSILDPRLAKLLLNFLSIGIFTLALYKLFQKWKIPQINLAVLPLVFCYPLYNCILFGQPYLIVVGLIIFGVLQLQSQNNRIGYLAWPLAILLKVSPIVLLSIPLLERKFKDLFIYSVLIIAGILLSFIWIDLSTWVYYVTHVLSKVSDGILYNSYAIGAESMPVMLRHLMLHDPLLNPNPFIDSVILFTVVFACIKAILYTIGIRASSLSQIPSGQKVALWLTLLLLMSPNISSYGLNYLIVPYLYLIYHQRKIDIPASILLFGISIYSQSWVEDWPMIFQFGKLIGIVFFLIYFMYRTDLVRRLFDKWTIILFSALSLFFILLGGKWNTVTNTTYVLDHKVNAILHDCTLSENRDSLIMINHAVGGYNTTSVKLKEKSKKSTISPEELHIFNQVTQHKGVTVKKYFKVNNHIYYMTDEGRAPGFYTIKQLTLSKISDD